MSVEVYNTYATKAAGSLPDSAVRAPIRRVVEVEPRRARHPRGCGRTREAPMKISRRILPIKTLA